MLNTLATAAMIGMPGWPEMLIFGGIALVVFGPKRLPALARSLGQSITELKKGFSEVKGQIEGIGEEATKELKDCEKTLKEK